MQFQCDFLLFLVIIVTLFVFLRTERDATTFKCLFCIFVVRRNCTGRGIKCRTEFTCKQQHQNDYFKLMQTLEPNRLGVPRSLSELC